MKFEIATALVCILAGVMLAMVHWALIPVALLAWAVARWIATMPSYEEAHRPSIFDEGNDWGRQ